MSNTPFIIAEIASAHEGERDFALELFHKAAATGADAVKFQMFNRDTLLSKYHHKFDAFGIIQIDTGHWTEILSEAGRSEVEVHVEPFDETSLEVAEASGSVDGYKIPTSDISNLNYLKQICNTDKQIYLAVGGATMDEVDAAVNVLTKNCSKTPVLMLGFQSFPTKLEDSNLERIKTLRNHFGLPIGYADHIDAEDTELARILPAMAMSAGASVIEKHFTDDRSRKGRDHYSSLDPDEFTEFVMLMHKLAPVMGMAELELSPAELDYRHLMKRQAVASKEMKEGEPLDPNCVVYKRTGIDGLSPSEIKQSSQMKMKSNKSIDQPIVKEDLLA